MGIHHPPGAEWPSLLGAIRVLPAQDSRLSIRPSLRRNPAVGDYPQVNGKEDVRC